jgi:hypothetical protein
MEIGYGNTLHNLYSEAMSKSYEKLRMQWDSHREIVGANKMASLLAQEMGNRYARVVTRCLRCNCGIDETDLDEPAMQQTFFRDVVCELERCVKQIENMSTIDM